MARIIDAKALCQPQAFQEAACDDFLSEILRQSKLVCSQIKGIDWNDLAEELASSEILTLLRMDRLCEFLPGGVRYQYRARALRLRLRSRLFKYLKKVALRNKMLRFQLEDEVGSCDNGRTSGFPSKKFLPDFREDIERGDLLDRFEQALRASSVSEIASKVFSMMRSEGISVREASRRANLPESTVRGWLRRLPAMARLPQS